MALAHASAVKTSFSAAQNTEQKTKKLGGNSGKTKPFIKRHCSLIGW